MGGGRKVSWGTGRGERLVAKIWGWVKVRWGREQEAVWENISQTGKRKEIALHTGEKKISCVSVTADLGEFVGFSFVRSL